MIYQRIVAAIDRSPLGPMVFQQSLEMAKKEGAKLLLCHGVPVRTHIEPTLGFGIGGTSVYWEQTTLDLFSEELKTELQDAEAWLQQMQAEANACDIPTEYAFQMAEPGSYTCEVAQKWEADLIIVGRRGLQGINEILLGSTSNYVVHHAPCSVLVVQGIEIPEAA